MPAALKHLTNKKLKMNSLLAKWKDGLYYTAAIIKCDSTNKRCLVCFEDGSEIWLKTRDIHLQLSLDQVDDDEDIVCCICDDGTSEDPNFIILCDVCQQGYHQKCHTPPVDSSKIDDDKDWFCATCSYILNQSDSEKLVASTSKDHHVPRQEAEIPKKRPPEAFQQQQQQTVQPPKAKQPRLVSSPAASSSNTPSVSSLAQPKPTKSPSISPKQGPSTSTPPSISTPSTTITTSAQPHIKQSGTIASSPSASKTTKSSSQQTPKQAPYYPLSDQVRAAAAAAAGTTVNSTSSSSGGSASIAALTSLATSSTLLVGTSSGRTKQELLNHSSNLLKRQAEATHGPVDQRHAVRKSSINFPPPSKQSALPTATRSSLASMSPPAKSLVSPTAVASSINATLPTHSSPIISSSSGPSKDSNRTLGRSIDSIRDRIQQQQQSPVLDKSSHVVPHSTTTGTTAVLHQMKPKPKAQPSQQQQVSVIVTPVAPQYHQQNQSLLSPSIIAQPNPVYETLKTWAVDPAVATIPLITGHPGMGSLHPISPAMVMAFNSINKINPTNDLLSLNGSGGVQRNSSNGSSTTSTSATCKTPSSSKMGQFTTSSPTGTINNGNANEASTSSRNQEQQPKVIVSSSPTKSA